MALKTVGHRRRGSALLPSLGGAVVIGLVVLGNFWRVLHEVPELAPLDSLARLQALQASQLPANALAAGPETAQGRSDALAVAAPTAPVVAPMRLAAPGQAEATGPKTAITRSWVVQPGEGLASALQRLYVHGQTARDVIAAYGTVREPQKLQAGWRLWARFSSAGLMDAAALQSVVVAPQQGEGVTVERQEDGAWLAHDGGLPGTLQRQALRCGILGSLEDSLRRCGEGEGLAAQLQILLGDRLLRTIELRPGDELRVVMDKLMDGEHLVRYQRLLAVEVRSAFGGDRERGLPGGRLVALHFDDGKGTSGFFAPDGSSVEALFLRQPLRVGRTTSGYGMRLHPILHRMKAHYGVDFAAPRGTQIYAAADGHVTLAKRHGAAGNLVRLRHSEGFSTEYMHLQKFAAGLKSGQAVAKGQTIGYVGTTGRSTGPHLHFGVRQHGRYLDPATVGDFAEPDVPARERKAFEARADELLRLLEALDGSAGDRS